MHQNKSYNDRSSAIVAIRDLAVERRKWIGSALKPVQVQFLPQLSHIQTKELRANADKQSNFAFSRADIFLVS
jgi:hypothetical protein